MRRACAPLVAAVLVALQALQAPGLGAQAHTASRDELPAYRYRLLFVYDAATEEPVAAAEITGLRDGHTVESSETGSVSLAFLPEGSSVLRIRRLGYEVRTVMVSVGPADTMPAMVPLRRVTPTLDTMRATARARPISPGLNLFEERRLSGNGGRFITDSVLRAHEGAALRTVVAARLPGLTIVPGPLGSAYMANTRKLCKGSAAKGCGSPSCFVTVYQDGLRIYSVLTDASPLDVSQISADDYAGIEYYPSTATVPPQYGGAHAACGVLLLWSRER